MGWKRPSAAWVALVGRGRQVSILRRRLALASGVFGRTCTLSLLLTKALVARSSETSAGSSRNNPNNTAAKHAPLGFTHPFLASSSHYYHHYHYYLDLARREISLQTSSLLSLFLPPPPPPLSLTYAMASSAPSSASSDISTPRSTSPSSSAGSGRSSQSSVSHRVSLSSSRRISASNPMSSVDIATIEEAMKMANLDTLRGYTQSAYPEVHQFAKTEYITKAQAAGYQVLREPLWNKGMYTASVLLFCSCFSLFCFWLLLSPTACPPLNRTQKQNRA